jgi:divalent metal cation (Fe/Co/Zn/Cd) transporter
VFRHRLYGIDKIVSRTVSYSVLVALLGLAFFALVTALSTFVTGDEPVVIAIATLTVAALFNPVRTRVLRWVNRRFNRSMYHAQVVVEAFTETLRDRVHPEEVVDGWTGVVSETMEPAAMGVWVRDSE